MDFGGIICSLMEIDVGTFSPLAFVKAARSTVTVGMSSRVPFIVEFVGHRETRELDGELGHLQRASASRVRLGERRSITIRFGSVSVILRWTSSGCRLRTSSCW